MPDLARPLVVSQTEWDAPLPPDPARGDRRRWTSSGPPEAHADGAGRARLPLRGPDGQRSLPELFDGRSQLILYRFFFEEGVGGWPDAGCAGCSSFADGIPDLGLLHARDITFAMASPAPRRTSPYAERMGWTDVPWYTIRTERFSADFGVDEWFGLNVFLRDGDDVYRTYFLQHGPMVQKIGSVWSLFSSRPTAGRPTTRTRPKAGPGAAVVLVPPA